MSGNPVISGCGVLPPLKPLATRPANAKQTLKGAGGSGVRWQMLNAFVDETLKSLNGAQAKVWLVLYRDTKPDGRVRASDADLGRRAGLAARSARRARVKLVELGLVKVVRRGSLLGGASVYRVCGLVVDTDGRSREDKSGLGLRTPVSAIPERDQKGCPIPSGKGTQKKKSGASRSSEEGGLS